MYPSTLAIDEYQSELTKIMKRRSSVRAFTDQPVPDGLIQAILASAQHSPTSSNVQAYSFVVIRDKVTKKQLAELAGNQEHVEKCPVFIAICADIHRLEDAIAYGGGKLAKGHAEMSLVATIDAALVGMSASLIAESFGLSGCMIGAMRNHPAKVAQVLGLPDGVFVAFGMTLGYPASRPPSKPRYPGSGVIHWEKYETKPLSTLHESYNAKLDAQKEQTGRSDGVPWTHRLAIGFSQPKRLNLKSELKDLGFQFD